MELGQTGALMAIALICSIVGGSRTLAELKHPSLPNLATAGKLDRQVERLKTNGKSPESAATVARLKQEVVDWLAAQSLDISVPSPVQGERCTSAKKIFNSCAEECACRNGRWLCCRQRKEFSFMSKEEVRRYIMAYVKVTTQQPYKSVYDAMVDKHEKLFAKDIHKWPQFWPWHRYFILKLENMLRHVDCRVTLPYWDFTLHWRKPLDSKMWDVQHLGSNGQRPDGCVRDGPFRRGAWHITPSAGGGCLKRHFSGQLISPKVLSFALYYNQHASQLRTFERIISVYMHSGVHMALGGIMATNRSANEPSFWMLHSFADKLWAVWQSKGADFRTTPYSRMTSTRLSRQDAGERYTVADMYDTERLPGSTCVHYASEPLSITDAYRLGRLHGLGAPRSKARNLSRSMLLKLLSSLTMAEKRQMKAMKRELKGFRYY